MLRPSRPVPRIGAPAQIAHFGGRLEAAVVRAIEQQGRRLIVEDETGAARAFTLRRATAVFVLEGEQHSPRLRL